MGLLKNIHLTLIDNHYKINHKINKKVSCISYEEKTILMIDKIDILTNKKIAFDGENIIQMTKELEYDINFFKTKYILVQRLNFKKSIPEEYKEYIKMADELKLKSNGQINIYKMGTILKTAQNLLDETTKHITPENILFDEAETLQNATQGSTIFYDKYEGEGFKSDIKSMFPIYYEIK